jgi:hypothetical protein
MASNQKLSTMQMACEERRDFAGLIAGLSPDQWEQPSLCERWRVRDVVAHVLSYEELSRWGLVKRFAKGAFVPRQIPPGADRETVMKEGIACYKIFGSSLHAPSYQGPPECRRAPSE